jgi:flagellar biosynthesis protein FlhF
MKLKTFQAQTMADALAAVRKDLGPDAMILHTRSYRVGSWLGFGGKNMVEITASAGEGSAKTKRAARPAPARAANSAATSDDRSQVLGGETSTARAASRESLKPVPRDSAEIVVQRASSVVEPKPILTQSARTDTPTPARASADAPQPRPGIATRLPRREGSAPVRLSDATPMPEHQQQPNTPAERQADPTRVLDGFRRSIDRNAQESSAHNPAHRSPRDETRPGSDTIEPKPAPDRSPHTAPARSPAGTQTETDLRERIAGLEKMMGRVLESTRRTSIAVGRVSESAAEPVVPGPLLDLTNKLVENDAPMPAIDAIISNVRDRLDRRELEDATVVRQAVLREIENSIATKGDSLLAISTSTSTGKPRIISLVGPTGVGKTTTVAKLAAACKLRHGKRVGLITSDTYRIAAVEQLRTYAGIIGLPIKVVMSPEEMSTAIESLQGMDVVIVDTAGRSQHDGKRLEELRAFIDAAKPDETHLVLSSTVGNTVLERTAQKFKPLSPDRVILTKLDEAVCTGHIAGLTGRLGLPLSFITVGQEVPDDIEPARADRLARVALDGPDVLFGGSDGRG